jgi:hypothetical protein
VEFEDQKSLSEALEYNDAVRLCTQSNYTHMTCYKNKKTHLSVIVET